MSLLEAALELAGSGVAVFPCNADKSPRVAGGFKSASTNPQDIMDWSWDDALIGAAVMPGTVVVDVDPRNGGIETLELLKKQGQTLPTTRMHETRSGGFHLLYRVPDELDLRGTLGPGIDIKRAGKGYVISPPSAGYSVKVAVDPIEAPEWLIQQLKVEPKPAGTDEAADAKFLPFESGTPYGLAGLERELGRLATAREGGRNDALNKAAFALAQLAAGGELDDETALESLASVAERIGLEMREAHLTIDSGWGAGYQEPRQAPPREIDEERTLPSVDALDSQPDPEAERRIWVDWSVDEPPPPFYCDPLLPKNAYVLVYGATEAAKSMTWLGILAQGSHLGVRSSFYSLENPPHTDRDRLRRWNPDRANFRLTNEPIDLYDPRQVEALARREKEWGADVVLFDTYSHAFNSRSDDGNAKAIEFARRVRWVMAQVGCSVIVIDHTGFEGDEPRDASAKRQQVDVAVLMEKVGEWRKGDPARFSMRNRKAARFANPFTVKGEIRDVERDGRKGLELGWTFTAGDRPSWGD